MLERIKKVATFKYSLPGISDGGAHTKIVTIGSYTTLFLTDWVREYEMMDLEEAHWRLSTYPATVAGIANRGFIRNGAQADLIVYDFDALRSTSAERKYDFPAGEWRYVKKADGYRFTIVNGKVTFVDGEATGSCPGEVLRPGGPSHRGSEFTGKVF
jgi:N-acyl-D-aspartate/D-glutamate deacylase